MKTCITLPKSHKGNEIARIELERSRVLSTLIKTVSAVLAVTMFGIGCLLLPPSSLTEMTDVFEHLSILMLGLMTVMLAHELIRGLMMRIFSGVKPVIQYAGSYPHAGCEAYFGRSQEQVINLMPLAAMTALLLMCFFAAPDASWKWMVWIMLVVHVCSCVGDVYVSARLTRLPEDILVQNVGSTFRIFSAHKAED